MHLHTRQHHYSNAHTSAKESHDYHLSCELKKLHDTDHALVPPHDTSDQHPQKAHEGLLECQECHLKLAVETFSPTLKRAVSPVSIEQCVFLNSIVLCCGWFWFEIWRADSVYCRMLHLSGTCDNHLSIDPPLWKASCKSLVWAISRFQIWRRWMFQCSLLYQALQVDSISHTHKVHT